MSVALANSLGEFFAEVVENAMSRRQIEATAAARYYLIGLLNDLAHPDPDIQDALGRPLVVLFDEAMHLGAAERFRRLRALGDTALYVSGFFADHIENRGMDASYVEHLGKMAYVGAASVVGAHDDGDNVLAELAENFAGFVGVLEEVADATLASQARGDRGLIKVYERWLRSGSVTLAAELGARGIVPARGRGGIH